MSRLSSYPKDEVTLVHSVVDGHGNVILGDEEIVNVFWSEEVIHVTINNQNYVIKSWYLHDERPSNEHMTVQYDGKSYSVAGWVRYNQHGLKHYQVFLH